MNPAAIFFSESRVSYTETQTAQNVGMCVSQNQFSSESFGSAVLNCLSESLQRINISINQEEKNGLGIWISGKGVCFARCGCDSGSFDFSVQAR